MVSRQFKIRIVLLALAALAAAFLLRPRRFHVDRTQYEMIPVTDPGGKPLEVIAVNQIGQIIAITPNGQKGFGPIHRIDRDGHVETLPIPNGYRVNPCAMNDQGMVVGSTIDPNGFTDACYWDTEGRFHIVPVRNVSPNMDSKAEMINNQGMIAGSLDSKTTLQYSDGAFFYDPREGVIDVGSPKGDSVWICGMNEEGMLVGSYNPNGCNPHAFLWSRQEGFVDIHSILNIQSASQAIAISEQGWILLGIYDGKFIGWNLWYHPKFGEVPFESKDCVIYSAQTIGLTDRFFAYGQLPGISIGRFYIRSGGWFNLIIEPNQQSIILNPKVLSNLKWDFVGSDNQGAIYGNHFGLRNSHDNLRYPPNGFRLRPIRSEDSDKK